MSTTEVTRDQILTELSTRLRKGEALLNREWLTLKADPTADRTRYDRIHEQWIDMMLGFYALGGGDRCVLELAHGKCSTEWSPVARCWHCSKGNITSAPPPERDWGTRIAKDLTEKGATVLTFDDLVENVAPPQEPKAAPESPSDNGAAPSKEELFGAAAKQPAPSTAPPERPAGPTPEQQQAAAERLGATTSFIKCTREGCARTGMHVHISSIGHCRREVAYGLLGYDEVVKRPYQWGNKAKLGGLAEQILVENLRSTGEYELAHTLDDQSTVDLDLNGVLFTGHPDGDIRVAPKDGKEGEWMNLEFKLPKHEQFELWRHQGIDIAAPSYKAQAHGYMRAKQQQITRFEIMSGDTGETHTDLVRFDPSHWKSLVKRWVEVRDQISLLGKLPDPDHDGDQVECWTCAYRTLCPAWQAAHPGDAVPESRAKADDTPRQPGMPTYSVQEQAEVATEPQQQQQQTSPAPAARALTPQTITIWVSGKEEGSKEQREIEADHVVGGLAVNYSTGDGKEGYTITHVRSGFRLLGWFPSRDDVVDLAEHLAGMFDWDTIEGPDDVPKIPTEVRRALAAFASAHASQAEEKPKKGRTRAKRNSAAAK